MTIRSILLLTILLVQHGIAFSPSGISHRSPTDLAAQDRRSFLTILTTTTTATAIGFPHSSFAAQDKILVVGGTGLVGSRVVKKLQSMRIDVIATSTDGRDGTAKLDFSTSTNLAQEVETLAKGCSAVISTVGVIGTQQDAMINAASGLVAGASKQAGVQRFVYISVAPEVREFAKNIDFLQGYMEGKKFSEESVVSYFGSSATLIEPTFIYGGDAFGITPPRVTSTYGALIEGLLSSPPLRAVTSVAPEGIIKIGLEPPVAAETVANAAVAAALGKTPGSTLDTYDKIKEASTAV